MTARSLSADVELMLKFLDFYTYTSRYKYSHPPGSPWPAAVNVRPWRATFGCLIPWEDTDTDTQSAHVNARPRCLGHDRCGTQTHRRGAQDTPHPTAARRWTQQRRPTPRGPLHPAAVVATACRHRHRGPRRRPKAPVAIPAATLWLPPRTRPSIVAGDGGAPVTPPLPLPWPRPHGPARLPWPVAALPSPNRPPTPCTAAAHRHGPTRLP